MARTSKKSVYERIEDKLQNIKETEELLVQLNNELQELYVEKDELEMRQLLDAMKSKGLNINEALSMLQKSCSNDQDNEQDKPKRKSKKEIVEENNTTEE